MKAGMVLIIITPNDPLRDFCYWARRITLFCYWFPKDHTLAKGHTMDPTELHVIFVPWALWISCIQRPKKKSQHWGRDI